MKFIKMQGLGNDYIFVLNLNNEYNLDTIQWEKLAIKLSDRHFGIGGDGLVIISQPTMEYKHKVQDNNKAIAKMTMYNNDGSIGAMCGNAIRCVARLLFDTKYKLENWHTNNLLYIQTDSGVKACIVQDSSLKLSNNIKDDKMQDIVYNEVVVDMGVAKWSEQDIGINSCVASQYAYDSVNNSNNKNNQLIYQLSIKDKKYDIYPVSIGNPHSVIFLNDKKELDTIDISDIGRAIENCSLFNNRTNVEFCYLQNSQNIVAKVWERGSGYTLSCGTGACAIASVAIKRGLCTQNNNICITLDGGTLNVLQDNNGNLKMTGGCEYVFSGDIEI